MLVVMGALAVVLVIHMQQAVAVEQLLSEQMELLQVQVLVVLVLILLHLGHLQLVQVIMVIMLAEVVVVRMLHD
jgi:hypothetical protein